MKKINFKGSRFGFIMPIMEGAGGAALKMGVNFGINTLYPAATPLIKGVIGLGLPIVASMAMPKLFNAKNQTGEFVRGAVTGHNAICIYEMGMAVLPENIKAHVSGYSPYALAGYSPYALAGKAQPNLPFQEKKKDMLG